MKQQRAKSPNNHDSQRHGASFEFPGWLYGVLFVVFDLVAVGAVQWGVTQSPNPFSGIWGLASNMWLKLNFVLVLNLLVFGLVYLVVLMLFNRFWIATPVFLALAFTLGVLESFKVKIRYEAIIPSDLGFLGSNTGNMVSFMPSGAFLIITIAVVVFALIVALMVWMGRIDARRGRMVRTPNAGLTVAVRLVLVIITGLVMALFAFSVGTVGSWANSFAKGMGDIPSMWDSVYDAQRNGPVISFLRQLNPKIMDQPADYSKETMEAIAKRYADEAATINKDRSKNLTDSTVIYVLSESFSDPSRVPGVKLNEDAIPNIRSIKEQTTSGLMLSSGYGGGTANLEYMGLTGMSMANFDSSLTSPYQQLVPKATWVPTVNQLWGSAEHSLAFHPYQPSMYSRSQNYKKFGFSHFYALSGDDIIAHQDRIDDLPYVSDTAAYRSVMDEVSSTDDNQFVQLITMQNHMPYHNWYKNNEFTVTNTEGSEPLGSDETQAIQTYAKGASYTDKATKQFLDELDALSKPVTVVFYGDHLPGIYSTAGEDTNNSVALHQTDYFIWSNKASGRQGQKNADSAYSSPNYFIAQASEQMGAKVSPFIAFLTRMHESVAAMEPPVVNKIQGWDRIPEGQAIYLDAEGNPMSTKDFDETTKQRMEDYRLIQYDITAGKGYLKDTGFMKLPGQ